MNVALWGRALYTVQRVDKAAWTKLDIVSRWLIASRASVLVITFISVSIAGLMAIRVGRFDATLWVLASLALLFAHATNNLVNDLTDHLNGVDKNNYFRAVYGAHVLEHQLLSVRGLIAYAAFSGIVQSVDLHHQLLNVNTVQGENTEIFPLRKGTRVATANGGRKRLSQLTPGTNVLIYYEQRGDRRTVKQIVVLGAAPAKDKKASPPPS